MTESIEEFADRQLQTPAGRALRRMLRDPEFAEAVSRDAQGALSGIEVDADMIEALTADAAVLADAEVSGFAQTGAADRIQTGQQYRLPALRTVGALGLEAGMSVKMACKDWEGPGG